MCEKELSDQASQALDDLMCEFIKRYAPAKSWEQADEHFTSSEIAEMFNSVYPIPLESIFDALADFGNKNSCFCSAIVGAMVFFSIIRVFLNFLGTETACLSRCSNPTRRVLYAIIAI